ncbi:zinc-dependent metalloprotease [Pleionea litopenaei]|uniref:Zinc-dependent metalloprotease n=1 Tax=Pleionea litopenaei TaxID=3070815 RepID=A0AA51RQC3_9GAMM|nr:zinc-dependent metalloprotease [Pleionea sp. HL-JVS1]WMS85650.1 zinc-dependent metalloprotease [Pleionea sp. HL-JVS1]
MFARYIRVFSFLLIVSSYSVTSKAASTTIDVLVLYNSDLAAQYSGDANTRIQHLINVSNQIYLDSNIDIELRLVHSQLVSYNTVGDSEVALNRMTNGDSPFQSIADMRTTYGADMVIFMRPYDDSHNSCGIAWIGGYNSNGNMASWDNYMMSHVSATTCGDYVTAHELGHNMGLRHSRLQDGSGGTFPYALGHGIVNDFTTIMAYQSAFNVDYVNGKIYKFSSPNLTCNGQPCGVNRGNASDGADAVYTIGITAPQIANYFGETNNGNGGVGSCLATAQQLLDDAQTDYDSAKVIYDTEKLEYRDVRKQHSLLKRTALKLARDHAKYIKQADTNLAKRDQFLDEYNNSVGESDRVRNSLYKKYLRFKALYEQAVINRDAVAPLVAPAQTEFDNYVPVYEAAKGEYETAKVNFVDSKNNLRAAKRMYSEAENSCAG